ncbi:MAG: hypothetical protein Q9N62_09350 [Ghiorsea sp.]|nr:hypothetical protein [Ghiorsea sp.]
MSNDSKKRLYIKYKLKGPSKYKEATEVKSKGTVVGEFKKQSDISNEEYINLEKEHSDDIKKIKSEFTGKRKDWRGGVVAFYDWYKGQGQACRYCGISQDELYKLFSKDKNKKLPLNDAVKRSSGTLEIERRDSESNEYNAENCILACPLCNNAKSNLIDEENWMSLFVEPMREYYKKLLGKDLENKKPDKLAAKSLN